MPNRVVAGIVVAAWLTLGVSGAASAQVVEPIPPLSPRPAVAGAPNPPPRVLEDWEPGMPMPPGYHTQRRANVGPIVGGAVLFGVTYGLSVFAALATDVVNSNPDLGDPGGKNNHRLYLPMFGPFWDATQSWTTEQKWLLVVDGLAQIAGVGLVIYGICSPRTVLVRDRPSMAVVPMPLGRDAGGLAVAGTF